MSIEVNGVFEGGGMKAIGLVGAVKAAEEFGVRFTGLAGTSSGSIVASLLAAGYSADEMKQIIEETPFIDFLKPSFLHRIRGIGPFIRLFLKKGLYPGQAIEQWIESKLMDKGIRAFRDLKGFNLRIMASDISRGRLIVLPEDIEHYGIKPEELEIAKAVRMSTSIPYFFEPVRLRKLQPARRHHLKPESFYIVDGGILSNFPLWIFDQDSIERSKRGEAVGKVPTLGFSLVGRHAQVMREIYGPLSMFQALFSTMMEAHDERYIEKHNRFRTIKIPTLGVHTTEFGMNKERSLKLYEAGLKAGREFFSSWDPEAYQQQFTDYLRQLGYQVPHDK